MNIPRNWLHQGMSYMDSGELSVRILLELVQILFLALLLNWLFLDWAPALSLLVSFFVVHTWNWITNNLFWSIMIFTFPGMRNPGAYSTLDYLGKMRHRLSRWQCISGLALYGSLVRGKWHERSDIDIRLLRRPGIFCLFVAAAVTMGERFRAFLTGQPMDMFLADDVDFLRKMSPDEKPFFLICRDDRLQSLYCDVRSSHLTINDFLGDKVDQSSEIKDQGSEV